MTDPTQPTPEDMNADLLDDVIETGEPEESIDPLPQQVVCRACSSKKIQLTSLLLTDKVLLNLLCQNCGTLNDLFIRLQDNKPKIEKPYRNYLG